MADVEKGSEQQNATEPLNVEDRTPVDSDPPPSYDSVFGKVKKAKDDSSGTADYLYKVFAIFCCSTICAIITIALMLAIPIAEIVIGSLYLHDCPRERFIPIYLIVAGVFGAVKAITNTGMTVKKRQGGGEEEGKTEKPNPIDSIIMCFLLAWFIAGCVWIYSIYKDYQHEDPELPKYCHQTLYLFAFWLQTVTFILMGLSLVLGCCVCVIAVCVGKK